MPADALPIPRHSALLPGTVNYRRMYLDPLGRAMSGSAVLTPQGRADSSGVVVVAAPVPAEITGGVLDVNLPPNTYRVEATLYTVEKVRVYDADIITLT